MRKIPDLLRLKIACIKPTVLAHTINGETFSDREVSGNPPFYNTVRISHLSGVKDMLDRLALLLVVVGALNWGSVGLFQFDIVSWLFGGADSLISRIIFTLVGLAGLWCISLFFRRRNEVLVDDD